MRSPKWVFALFYSVALVLLICGFTADTAVVADLPIVVTSAPQYKPLAALRGEERFPKGAQLLLVQGGKAEQLVEGFDSTADASVSFDAKTILFAGKQSSNDPWQVWELKLEDRSVRKVIESATDAVRPLYLPGGMLVFARRTGSDFELVTAQLDGSKQLPISHLPASALPADVLRDGRILFEAGYPLGSGSTPEMFLVYSDGSGVESYRCDHGAARWGGRQVASGDVVFTHGSSLARFTSPLANEAHVTAPAAQYAGAIAETLSGTWIVSSRTTAGSHFSLRSFTLGKAVLQPIFAQSGEDLVEPVLLVPRERPRQHPSALHDWNYANLLALDARQSRDGALKETPAIVRLETLDTAAGHAVTLGTALVEADGSFFVKTPADTPIRFSLLDAKGATIRQEHGWFWTRRGEQRICVGCHVGPEHASENRVPEALLRSTTPADLTGSAVSSSGKQTLAGGR